ncbi:MAG: acetoacetate--CoA ligase [Chromatiales bacterium]|nr:acetoacetate--CoA ligase [Chromatiales bacterium]
MKAGPGNPELWRPGAARSRDSGMRRFREWLGAKGLGAFTDYPDLHAWSLREPAEFWESVARFAGLDLALDERPVLEGFPALPGTRWFPGRQLNFAACLLRDPDERLAMIWRDETGARRSLTRRELHEAVAGVQAGLRAAGLAPGDRVAAMLPNAPEAVIAMLAVTALGGTWTCCSPDFGADAVLERFGQVAPRLLFVTDGYHWAGRRIDVRPVVAQLAAHLPSVERIISVPGPFAREPAVAGTKSWSAFVDPAARQVEYTELPFDHPLYILYSSGTTGAPKCIVHGAGGTLLTHLKEHLLHVDLKPSDRLFYFTTCGWMMWNWQVSALATGAALVLYEGSPMHPDPGVLWRMAGEESVTIFGTSARYLASLEKAQFSPRRHCRPDVLRTVLSTGSPLLPSSFDFVYREIGADLHLASIAGGTDIVGCFLAGNPELPVRRGELQCAALGMAVEVFDERGRAMEAGRGELVCTQPFPSMPLGFWNDPEGERYRAAYFGRFPGVWTHGDDVERLPSGGWMIHGRSDAVLNPGGVRIGTAEIYRQLAHVAEVREGLAVGQDWDGDTRIVLFVELQPGCVLDASLVERIRARIRACASPRHVPARVLAVPELPRTRSGKLVELAVRAVIHGRNPGNLAALANPGALDHFRDRAELQS